MIKIPKRLIDEQSSDQFHNSQLIIIVMNKYEVIGVIDEGAYGTVLKATLKGTDTLVAIKKFKETDEEPSVRGPIQSQIKMLKALRSDFVVDIKEAFRKYAEVYRRKGRVYLVFEFMQKNLLNLIEEHPTGIPPSLTQRLTHQMVKCVNFLHQKNVVHRDLKPENLLLSSNMDLKLCDFGFTRIISDSKQALTEYVATRWYRSPELLVGEPYGKPLDMWSIGCIVFEMITGEPLFPGENQIDQLHLIRRSLGELTVQHKNRIKINSKFTGIKFPQIRKLEAIESKLLNKASKNVLQFIKDCLILDPADRLNACDALEHPYFANLRTANLKSQFETQHRQYSSPLLNRQGICTEKNGYRTKIIINSKSHDNVWKLAGINRLGTQHKTIQKDDRKMMPNLRLTITQLNNNGSSNDNNVRNSPDSNLGPNKDTIQSHIKAKMSLVSHNQNDHQGKKVRNPFRLSHLKMGSLININCRKGDVLNLQRNRPPEMNFTISGETKSLAKKI